jgi:hypothetical protein
MATAAPLSANQPSATLQLQAAVKPPINMQVLERLGQQLQSKVENYETDRRLAELKWLKNARQYLGIYDPDVDKAIPKNRSRAYPKLTRVKCVSMLSRLMNLLFQVEEKNWTVGAPAVPDLSQEDLQTVLDGMMGPAGEGAAASMGAHQALFEGTGSMPQAPNVPSDDAIEAAVRKFAGKRAARIELEIEDMLQELGGNKSQSYVALCRRVLASGIQYGAGILRGPFVEEQKMVKWQLANQRLVAVPYMCMRPRFEFVPIWDYYPDMSAKMFAQMEGQFLRVVMSKHQVVKLKTRPDFMKDQIEKFLAQHPQGNYRRRQHETELRALGSQDTTSTAGDSNKFEAFVWEGYVNGRDLQMSGAVVPDDKLDDDVRATVWIMDGTVIKADIDPWTTLAPDAEMQQYHHFIFEEDESFLLGNALPSIMRDSQMGVAAATRMMLDNASVMRVTEINTALLRTDIDVGTIEPDMMIYRDDDNPATAQYPAVREIKFDTRVPELAGIIKMFQEFADSETFVNPATGGDLQKGPSEPFRTAAGASMLRGDAALPFKDVVRNFDVFTESVIGAVLLFIRTFATDPRMKGEFAAVARGATSLIAKEVLGAQIDNLAQTLTDEEKRYLKPLQLLRARVRVRDMSTVDVVMNDEEAEAADQAFQERQDREQEQRDEMVTANIRKVLSDTLKNIAQAGKNSATAEAATANVILAALEAGLNPDMLASVQPSTEGKSNGAATGASTGAGPAESGQGEQPGTGFGGLEAAVGNPVAASRPQPAAMPLQ